MPSSPRTSLTRTAAALVIAAALTVGFPSVASAHDALVASTPAADSTVPTAPTEITLTFNGELLTDLGTAVVEVSTATEEDLTDGEPLTDGMVLTQRLTPVEEAGPVTVRWRVVSSDGHPIIGGFVYTVESAPQAPIPSETLTATVTPTPEPTPTVTAGPSSADGADASSGLMVPVLIGLSIVIVAAGLLFLSVMLRRRAATGMETGDDR